MSSHPLHVKLLKALQAVASHVDVLDERYEATLQCEQSNILRVFVPDVHLVSRHGRTRLVPAPANTQLLTDVFRSLLQLKGELAALNAEMHVFQLGDFFDLWRESAQPDLSSVDRICQENVDLLQAVTDDRLATTFVYGNHDVGVFERTESWFLRWRRHQHLPRSDGKRFGLILHGDIFDLVERVPDAIQQWAVYYGKTGHELTQYLAQYAAVAQKDIRTTFGVRSMGVAAHRYLRGAARLRRDLLAQHADLTDLRLIVIGHTHAAQISVHANRDRDRRFVLMDCGAWIGSYEDASGRRYPNAQIGAMAGNLLRVYQLHDTSNGLPHRFRASVPQSASPRARRRPPFSTA